MGLKFQTHIAEEETLYSAPSPEYFKDETRFEYFKRTGFSERQWRDLKQYSLENGLNSFRLPSLKLRLNSWKELVSVDIR